MNKVQYLSSYPTIIIPTETHINTVKSIEISIDRIGKLIIDDKVWIRDLLSSEKATVESNNKTHVFLSESISGSNNSRFVIFHYFKQHVLEDHQSFQHMLIKNHAFITYTAIILRSDTELFFKRILSNKHTDRVNSLYQHMNMKIYVILTNMVDDNNFTQTLEKMILTMMQVTTDSIFNKLFKEHFQLLDGMVEINVTDWH